MEPENPGMARCESCGGEFSKANIARHRRPEREREEEGRKRWRVEGGMKHHRVRGIIFPKTGVCPNCGETKSNTNMAQHLRSYGASLGVGTSP